MATVEMVMPKMGESIMEATVLKWLKEVGDEIEQDEAVLEVATDKVDTEIPATHAGVLKEILAEEGDVVEVGKPIAIISIEESVENAGPETHNTVIDNEDAPSLGEVVNNLEQTVADAQQYTNGISELEEPQEDRFYSPLVLSIAKEEKISMDELSRIPGSGLENRVTKKDILAYVKEKKLGKISEKTTVVASPQTQIEPEIQTKTSVAQESITNVVKTQVIQTEKPAISLNGNTEIIEMDRMRKMIASRMVESKRISPHVTSFVEVDVTNVVLWRNKVKKAFEQRTGEKITFTPIFMEAIAKTIKDFPMVNISVDGDKIIRKKEINIGMATALPSGNLIVPVIQQADELSLTGLSKRVNDLARRARENKLKPDELAGGTYTVSNIGSFGNEMGTPIIMQPQVAIMAIGAIKKKPAVIETETGDMIGIRHLMFISHSYDHRVVDGALGGMFARRFADYLESFDVNREI